MENENENERRPSVDDCLAMLPPKERGVLEEYHKKLETQANTDFSTETLNKRGFNEQIKKIEKQVRKGEIKQVVVIYGDVDNLKRINDDLGHALGSELLESIAGVLRRQDIVVRLGGDEFGILLLVSNEKKGFNDKVLREKIDQINTSVGVITEELKKGLPEGMEWPTVDDGRVGTMSFGGQILTGKEFLERVEGVEDAVDALMAGADGKMYLAKE